MFVFGGRRTKVAQAGGTAVGYCGLCHRQASFTRVVQYTSCHVYGFIRWATALKPYSICGSCGGAHPAAHGAVGVRDAVPFWDRNGWLIVPGAFAVLVLMAAMR